MKILLINPGTSDDIDSRIVREIPYLSARAFFAPHAVAAIAALTPPEHHVEIHDEYARGPVDPVIRENAYDIIGVSISTNQLRRCLDIAGLCKSVRPAATVVAGGIGAEHLLHKSTSDASVLDVVFHGEAEETWPRFLADFARGAHQRMYKNVAKPDMTTVPPPRWELIGTDIASYCVVSVQTTRGCPFDCSFCDVIYTYGRKPRSKTIDQVMEEIRRLHELRVRVVFFADDNFAGDRKYAKELLRTLIAYNNSLNNPISFLTQLDITVARDPELLELMADCNFHALMIGIESVNENSLRDMNKHQNVGVSLVESVRTIQSYGMAVLAHIVIGADSDDTGIFARTADFIGAANIVHHFCHPLSAPPGTKMWYDLKRQGRVIAPRDDGISEKLDITTNIIPRRMTRVELLEGLADYWESIYDPRKFKQRAIAFVQGISRRPRVRRPGLPALWRLRGMLGGVFRFYLFSADKDLRAAFFSILRAAGPRTQYLMPRIIYLCSSYLMDYRRSTYDAGIARAQAQWEREHGEALAADTSLPPIPEAIRAHAPQIFAAAYRRVRETTDRRESLYSAVVAAMMDYCDRFGASFDTLDEYQTAQINASCDRIVAAAPAPGSDRSAEMPPDPPAGFARDILDTLDSAVRLRGSGS